MLTRRIPEPTASGQSLFASTAGGPYVARMVSWLDLASIPADFPPTQADVETILASATGFNSASDGQVLGKSGGAWAWSTPGGGGGSPGGSDGDFQIKSGTSFTGSSNFNFNGTDLDLLVPSGTVRLGDGAGAGHGTTMTVAPTQLAFACGGSFRLTITTTYMYVTSPGNTVEIGDPEGFGNSTKVIVDDANERLKYNKKAVLTDTASLYVWDSGTTTYWKRELVSGVEVLTDTGSASEP